MMGVGSEGQEKEVMLFLLSSAAIELAATIFGVLYDKVPSSVFDRYIASHMKSMFTKSVKLVIKRVQDHVSIETEAGRTFIYSPENYGEHGWLWEQFYSSSNPVDYFYMQALGGNITLYTIRYDNMHVQFDPA